MSPPSSDGAAPYRADIDGLRAISVVAVILFHADLPGAEGGFVGVDVFFVISGYLITQWLLARAGLPWSALLREFYLRRARRILPALLLVLCVSSAVALWLLQPADLVRFGKYLAAAVFMAGNFAALGDGDYFGATIGFAPLLHLWSIAVEEQFYLLYPLLVLALLRRTPRFQVTALVLLTIASFALCAWGAGHRPVVNFYIGATRAWELLLGALAAYGCFDIRLLARVAAPVAAVGLGAIVMAIASYRRDMGLPGVATLLPVAGTLAVIVAGRAREHSIARLLGSRPLAVTGLASYSLYLWHLPVIVFASYWMIAVPRGAALAALLAVIVALAFASWALFEEPLRRRRWLPSGRRFMGVTLAALAVTAALGISLWRSQGLPARLSTDDQRLLESAVLHPDAVDCMRRSLADIAAARLCTFGARSTHAPRAVLWGDSHALALLPALEDIATRRGFTLYYAGRSACRPMLDVFDPSRPPRARHECVAYNFAMRQAIERLRPQIVVLAAFWALPELSVAPIAATDRRMSLADALRDTRGSLQAMNARVCLVRDVPVLVRPVPYGLVMANRRGIDTEFLRHVDPAWTARLAAADAAVLAVSAGPDARSADPASVLCDASSCRIEEHGRVLFRDSNHLSMAGASQVSPALESCFSALPAVHAGVAPPRARFD
jgi:peptidoglycan/LPS O-acetylase OafA/YrhL